MSTKKCELCGRMDKASRHHLIPRTMHSKKRIKRRFIREEMNRLVNFCPNCHFWVHAFFSEAELADQYNTVDALRAHPKVKEYVEWIRSKPEGFRLKKRGRPR